MCRKIGKINNFFEKESKSSQTIVKKKTINLNNKLIDSYEHLNTEEKENMLINVYNSLKNYFENKKTKKPDDEVKVDSNAMLQNLNNMLTFPQKNMLKKIKITNVNNGSKISGINEESKSIKSYSSMSRNFRISRLGTISNKSSKNEFNEDSNENENKDKVVIIKKNQRKIQKSKDSHNIYSGMSEDSSSNKVIEEVEEEKNIPWIREEDC